VTSADRENFSPATKRTIALRSGCRCAHPECDGRTTVGPAKQPDKHEDTGEASHIFAASKRGPRGQGNLKPAELASVTNGIWLCSKHAGQVDTNDGKDYPPPVLLGWKAAHEFRIAREHGAMLHPFGWIEALHIVDAPVFRPDQKITFSNVNVIVGDNEAGKTTICEWLSCLKDSSALWRWGAYPSSGGHNYDDVKVAIDIRAPARHRVRLEVSGGRIAFSLDDQNFPFSPVGYEIVAIREDAKRARGEEDHILIANALGMDPIDVQALAEHINDSPGVRLKGASWDDVVDEDTGKKSRELKCNLAGGYHAAPFKSLSGGETGGVLLDLSIARAKILAAYRPTLLTVETSGLSMSPEFLSQYLVALSSPDIPFQTIFVTTELDEKAAWGGWQVIRLTRPREAQLGRQQTEIIVGEVHAS